MNGKFSVRKANENDIPEIQKMIKGLAVYEKRPQDMTASVNIFHVFEQVEMRKAVFCLRMVQTDLLM